VLLIGSNLLGNAITTARFAEILGAMEQVELTTITFSQAEVDAVPWALARRFHSLSVFQILRGKLWPLRTQTFDVIVSISVQPLLALGGMAASTPLVLWFDALPFHPGSGLRARLLNHAAALLYRRPLSRVTTLLAASRNATRAIENHSFPRLRGSAIAYAGVDTERWAPRVSRVRGGRTRVLSVANDIRRKGILDFFAYARDHSLDLSAFSFCIATGEPNDELRSLARIFDLQIITDATHARLDELIALYHDADIFFLPTKADMMPHVLLEACAAGLPIVASDVGAISEVVEEGRTGFLVKSLDWHGFYEALRKAAQFESYDNSEAMQRFGLARLRAILADALYSG
jgi:glycosyltransferase involved in cell wall biosynthesis